MAHLASAANAWNNGLVSLDVIKAGEVGGVAFMAPGKTVLTFGLGTKGTVTTWEATAVAEPMAKAPRLFQSPVASEVCHKMQLQLL